MSAESPKSGSAGESLERRKEELRKRIAADTEELQRLESGEQEAATAPPAANPPQEGKAAEPLTAEQERNERVKEAVARTIELIESDPDFDWLIHTYTSGGYKDFHYDTEKGGIAGTRNEADQIPLYSTGSEAQREPFKFNHQVRDDNKFPDGKMFVTWMTLGSTPFRDGNPFLGDPRGSWFACALRWRATEDAMKKIGNEALEKYLSEFSKEEQTTDAEFYKEIGQFVTTLADACNSKWAGPYWAWIKTLRR